MLWPLSRFVPAPGVARLDVLEAVRRIELRARRLVDSRFGGEHVSVFHGRGLEFSHLRDYQFGDDVRAIDWKVTARRGRPYVRQFVEERDLLVVLVVDVSASGRFSTGKRTVAEIAADVSAVLAVAATRNNDRVALLLVSDHVEHMVPPGSGRKHVLRILTDLLTHEPAGRGTDLTAALERITGTIRGRATVFIVSDFIQDAGGGSFRQALKRLARAHDLVAVRLFTEATEALPPVGYIRITDPESGRRVVVDGNGRKAREEYRRRVREARIELGSLITGSGAELVDVDTGKDPFAVLSDFFRRRHKVRQ